MPVTASQIKWGAYSVYEGPYFPGVIPYRVPEAPDFQDKLLRSVTATEGGSYDAINMYDSCIISVGIIQLCEKLFKVTDLLGACAASELATIKDVLSQLPVPADLRKNQRNQWRLVFSDGRGEVDTPDKMRALYLGGATGQKGSFSEGQKAHAREVAAAFASMWDSPGMRAAQVAYLKPTLTSYVMAKTRQVLFADPSEDGMVGALKAAVVSYSANSPVEADKRFQAAVQDPKWAGASPEGNFVLAMKSMVFGSQIAIWPGRYAKIQPVIEQLFGVDLPTLQDLAGPSDSPSSVNDELNTVKGIQQLLLSQGYDLGPAGADGVSGPKTKEAVISFQCKHGLYPDGIVGPQTRGAMERVARGG